MLENFEIPFQIFFMTQAGQFCTLQMGNFLQMLQNINTRTHKKNPARNNYAIGAETNKQTINGGN